MSPKSNDVHPPIESDSYKKPIELLQSLIQFDTTNPPGDELECINWIKNILDFYGIDSTVYAKDSERPNLIARINGGEKSGLMLYGHADVVTTQNQNWTYPPFEGEIHDDVLWGRGTLDMKGGLAMYISSFIKAAISDVELSGDLVLCILSDEENGSDFGAGYMVNQHPSAFEGVDYAIGELGGFSTCIGGNRFYPIQVSEKQVCWLEASFYGEGGHASMARQGGIMADMAKFTNAISGSRLPVHVTPIVEQMVEEIVDGLDQPEKFQYEKLIDSKKADSILDNLDDFSGILDSVLHNTANPTKVHGGTKTNVFPSEITVSLDCRILPGQDKRDLLRELRDLIPNELKVDLDVIRYESYPEVVDLELFPILANSINELDPEGRPIPFMLPAFTDARHFVKLGIQSYGYTPMKLPDDFDYMKLVHASDERIPVDAITFGAEAVFSVIKKY